MMPLITAAILTSILFLVHSMRKEKKPWYNYATLFLIFSGIGFFFSSTKSEACQIPKTFDQCMEIVCFETNLEKQHETILQFISVNGMSEKHKKEFLAKAKKHKKQGCEAYGDAKDRCFLLPSIEHRKKAEICFNTGLAMATSGTPYTKIVAAVLSLLGQYGLSCIDEWNYIDTKMQEASFHFGQYEWYMELLTKENV